MMSMVFEEVEKSFHYSRRLKFFVAKAVCSTGEYRRLEVHTFVV